MPQQLAFHDLVLEVPSPGRYELAMLVGGEEIGRQPVWIGTAAAVRRLGPQGSPVAVQAFAASYGLQALDR